MLQHYVFLKFRDNTTAQHIDAFCKKMYALSETIAHIKDLEIGRDELHDARSWDLVLIMRFPSVAALRAYQQHPEHIAVMQFNDPFVDKIASVDFQKNQNNFR